MVSSNFCCRPVKIIRIVSQHTGTVKEIIIKRAVAKIKLTSAVTAEGQVSPRHKCDVILENRPDCHILYFKKYKFQVLKPLWFFVVDIATLDILYNWNSLLCSVL